jgi:hypothetical protein
MNKGISLYPGLGMDVQTSVQYLEKASQRGLKRLFMSFHLPEANVETFKRDVSIIVDKARELHMDVVGDFVPGTEVPDGVKYLRLDDGFSPEAVAALQKRYPDRTLVLNASTINEQMLAALKKNGVDLKAVEALHNFYPRPHTGISEFYFEEQNSLLRAYDIRTGAFAASHCGCRGPLYAGLPTMEVDRKLSFSLALQHLALLGTDTIFIGDDRPGDDELDALASLDDVASLTLLTEQVTPLHEKMASHIYEVRRDRSEEVIRAANGRALWKGTVIPATGNEYRLTPGSVTLDNNQAGRYAGEVEICLADLPADPHVNRMGSLLPEELFLLPLLRGGIKFRFVPRKVTQNSAGR